ncbi:MAG: hypothetical protein ACI8UO_002339 [Verrucomicrobiales bacterium]|jgi:hypothetical protein
MIVAASPLDFNIIQVMACIFTILSGVASIALTIHKFQLKPWAKATLIVGVLIIGLVIVIAVVPMITAEPDPTKPTGPQASQADLDNATLVTELNGGAGATGSVNFDKNGDPLTIPTRGKVKRVTQKRYFLFSEDGSRAMLPSGEKGIITVEEDEYEFTISPMVEGDDETGLLIEYRKSEWPSNRLKAQLWPLEKAPFSVQIITTASTN